MLGGPNGHEVVIHAGDIAVLRLGPDIAGWNRVGDFLVVGAYPRGQTWDICRQAPDTEATARMAALPYPASDPLQGAGGPLTQLWSKELSNGK